MDKLNTLVIASGLANSVVKVDGLDLKAFWKDAFMVASIATWLAQHTEEVEADIAFTTGIIYNIGRLLLHLATPKDAMEIQHLVKDKKASRIAAEMERLNFTTQDAGKALLDLWKFPSELGVAIQQYKRPLGYEAPTPLSAVLNLANYLNGARSSGRSPDDVKQFAPKKVLQLAGIPLSIIDNLEEALTLETGLEP